MTNTLNIVIEKQVPFYDVDSYRIVWHGHYPKYFEEARGALLEKIGCTYEQMEEWGYFYPVIDLQIKYVKPLKYKQNVQISATLKEWQNKLVIDYLITDTNSGARLTKGRTQQVAISMPDEITQYESPELLLDKIQSYLND
ncbi:MAG: acyl-CoA thioesterase [Acidiferrobacterales bacterium]|nr:acyl-CoA thioesterase [Acidiferrobacterales bacterium]